jgi:hypothetical protein
MVFQEQPDNPTPTHLIRDNDSTLSDRLDNVFADEKVKVIRTCIRAPNMNAHMERWLQGLGVECPRPCRRLRRRPYPVSRVFFSRLLQHVPPAPKLEQLAARWTCLRSAERPQNRARRLQRTTRQHPHIVLVARRCVTIAPGTHSNADDVVGPLRFLAEALWARKNAPDPVIGQTLLVATTHH